MQNESIPRTFSDTGKRFRLISTVNSTIIAVLLISFLLFIALTGAVFPGDEASVTQYDWRVVRVFPHDPEAFTQGLIFRDGYIYESTGRRGRSEIRKIRPETGEIVQRRPLDNTYFGEGLTVWNNQLIQLTLSSGKGFVYNLPTFDTLRTFTITGEGWGLTEDGQQLIMSDGTPELRFLDPETFQEIRRITVTQNGKPVPRLNELEMIGQKIFANVLFSDKIVIIDPRSGEVTGQVDLERLVTRVKKEHSVNTLNGIAYDSVNDRIFITGKLWPNLYEIKIRPRDQARKK